LGVGLLILRVGIGMMKAGSVPIQGVGAIWLLMPGYEGTCFRIQVQRRLLEAQGLDEILRGYLLIR
jgi:hypothetical protein